MASRTSARTIPQLVPTLPSDARNQVACWSVIALLVGTTLVGYLHGGQAGPQVPPFLVICATVWCGAELLTAFLLFSQFYVAGRIGPGLIASGYLLSGLLTVPYLLYFPGVFTQGPLTIGDMQVSVCLWLTWHFLFPLTIAAAHLVDGSLERVAVSRARVTATLGLFVGGTVAVAGVIFAAVYFGRDLLPTIVLPGGHFSAAYRWYAVPPMLASNALALAIVVARGRRLTALQMWLCVALLTMMFDALLNIWSPGRYSVAWFIGKFEALIMATVVLFMLLLEVAAGYRRLYEVATIDVLTGLQNRRSFMHEAKATLARREQESPGVALLVIDVDHFKEYNDRNGHGAGDEALAAVASALRGSAVRARDTIARYGGEEFVLLLPNVQAADALAVAERIRERVSRLGIAHGRSSTGNLTVSVGIGYYGGTAEVAEPLLFAFADRALYAAKDNGRNCVVLHHVTASEASGAALAWPAPVVRGLGSAR